MENRGIANCIAHGAWLRAKDVGRRAQDLGERTKDFYFSFPANAGSLFLAGQVVRLNVCVGRETLKGIEGERVAK
jgi:hypothetical protein